MKRLFFPLTLMLTLLVLPSAAFADNVADQLGAPNEVVISTATVPPEAAFAPDNETGGECAALTATDEFLQWQREMFPLTETAGGTACEVGCYFVCRESSTYTGGDCHGCSSLSSCLSTCPNWCGGGGTCDPAAEECNPDNPCPNGCGA